MKRDSLVGQWVYSALDLFLGPLLDRLPLTPDHLSWLGLLFSLLAGAGFAFWPPLGALLLLLAGGCDLLDGYLARRQHTASPAGAFLDSVLDRYGELFVLLGVWGGMYRVGQPVAAATLAVLFTLSGSLLVSYTRARGEGLGVRCTEGVFQRPERLLALAAAGLFDPLAPGGVLLAVLVLLGAGTHLTAAQRLRWIRKELSRSCPAP